MRPIAGGASLVACVASRASAASCLPVMFNVGVPSGRLSVRRQPALRGGGPQGGSMTCLRVSREPEQDP